MAARPRSAHRTPRRLFVTGGSGFLGRHLVGGPMAESWVIAAPSSTALDLRNAAQVASVIADFAPSAVIHTAYRRGDRAAIVDASTNVAEAAARVGARVVHLSSDALFAGRLEPYTDIDEPDPVHDYGVDKADAERAVTAAAPDAAIVRTSLLYDRQGLSIHEHAVRDAVAGTSDMAFFTDEIRSPVFVEDLAAVLLDLAGRTDVTGTLNVAGPRPFSRADLAVYTARQHGWNTNRLRFSSIAESGLARPGRVVLDSSLAASHGWRPAGPG